ncbi:3'-5' exoribonuclease YhaM family protein [Desulfosporosinus sp. BICA1-9]|uniref:3'-5' exoribonuclease YhaM family protein n=1 Tax=Desulfosporosinus sp. BICA1-9 TaxID=1531958 RepID=UPI00054B0D0C|nr:HD domain-containing protein [Desulfosporosinus sp. BICA1-9]KJS49759.1 MAG: phosphohydrolase [Peptococcaceae bacterium BRH_c23]KJS90186.1 MAG: phosphohydrolase [Desulfosporosinus sp. BICA1-9]HBW38778.1 HD domain-containing protein [Desulfosporosinus sp.]
MLKDCKAGERFEGTVLVNEWKEVPFRQKPGAYLSLTCQDRSGMIQGKMWNYDPQVLGWLNDQDIFRVKGVASEYRGTLDLTIETIRMIPQEEVDLSDLLPSSPVTAKELEHRLQSLLAKITQPELKALLDQFLIHPVWGAAYRQAPAALKIHQAYLRGLWEHSIRVAEMAAGISVNYLKMDRDLVITGALLHDVGKIGEYSYTRGIKVTTEGRLLGHIILGIELLSEEIARIPNFPRELRSKLLHILTSHHGKYEWQSPKRPKLMEALVIHHADVMDAELFHFEQAKENHPEDEWSPYIPSMERCIYLK